MSLIKKKILAKLLELSEDYSQCEEEKHKEKQNQKITYSFVR